VAAKAIPFIKVGYLLGTKRMRPAPRSGKKIIQDKR
jgi:hypothetical protein